LTDILKECPSWKFVQKALEEGGAIDVSNVVYGSAPMHIGVAALFEARAKFTQELSTKS
jgi:hypothetical protein